MEGVVVNTGPHGTFIDVGAECNALLLASVKDSWQFRHGDIISACRVDYVDLTARRLRVRILDIQAELAGNRMPLEMLKEGDVVDGVVTNVSNSFGVFINVGAARDGRLSVDRRFAGLFRRGQVIRDLRVASVDLAQLRIALALVDPEAASKELLMVGKPEVVWKSMGDAREDAPAAAPRKAFVPGCAVDGVISSITLHGIFVDVLEDDPSMERHTALLHVPPEKRSEFQEGDYIEGMQVVRAGLVGPNAVWLELSMEDPELGGNEQDGCMTKTDHDGQTPQMTPSTEAQCEAVEEEAAAREEDEVEELEVAGVSHIVAGQLVDGCVTFVSPEAVFVDLGSGREGVLEVPAEFLCEFQKGDEVKGMLVNRVDSDGKVFLSIEDPDLFPEDEPDSTTADLEVRQRGHRGPGFTG